MWPFTKQEDPRAELDNLERELEMKLGMLLQESLGSGLDLNNRYVDTDRFLDDQVGGIQGGRVHSLREMRDIARDLLTSSAHARNVQNLLSNFTVGEGFCVKFLDEDLNARWKQISNQIRWKKRVREIVRRVVRDGEAFVRRFDGQNIRFIDPELIDTPPTLQNRPDIVDGVQYDGKDAENVIAYWVDQGDGTFQPLKSDKVFHFKDPDSNFNDMRGRPPFYDPAADIHDYGSFLKTRHLLNKIRASLAYIRKHKSSTPAQIKSVVNALKDGTFTKQSGKTANYMRQIPGVGIDTTDQIDLEFPRANLDSTDAEVDGRLIRLKGACWFSLPEYMYACDARNANFSSTLVAETPGIKALQSWQNHFGEDFRLFFQWYLQDPTVEVEFTWPLMVSREPLQDANAKKIMWESGVISTQTWQELAGLIPEVEEARGALPMDQILQAMKDEMDVDSEEEEENEPDDASQDAGEDDE